ncbi:hypothetical protein Francci3_0844 [Frankia casuarinae]|uniref:Uncharacterized protein n=1 Tax=Frankia casuarinae (strain DSM 45818 / CECT 9043 / HFP020203 / CcI3) TaxID=106370 RepID=Q2JER4_FRACC|nr:hypothetical protein Francci3_0844 [Frankia casuarinae]
MGYLREVFDTKQWASPGRLATSPVRPRRWRSGDTRRDVTPQQPPPVPRIDPPDRCASHRRRPRPVQDQGGRGPDELRAFAVRVGVQL